MMRVRVLHFQMLRQLAGCDAEEMELPAGSTVGAATDAVCARHPALAPMRRSLLFAVNEEWAPAGAELHDGDTLALMPPVSGG